MFNCRFGKANKCLSQWPRGLRRGCRVARCWNCGFEYRLGHGCLSVASVVCCQLEVSVSGRSLFQRRPTKCCVTECDQESWIMRRPWPTMAVVPR